MDHSKNKRRNSFLATCAVVARMDRKEVRQNPMTDSTSNGRVDRGRRISLLEKALLSIAPPHEYNQPHNQMMSIPSSGLAGNQMVQRGGRRKFWKNILRLWNGGKIASPTIGVEKLETDSKAYKSKLSGHFIRVVVTEINPHAYYKTLEINPHTTVFEVIDKLIRKYALKDEDRDPNEYYLTEVKEGHQGSYSRVLSNSDKLYEIQSKWDAEEECYFSLYGVHLSESRINVDPSIEDKFEQPSVHMKPLIISPSQDSFYNMFPNIGSTVIPSSDIAPSSLHSATYPTVTTTDQDPCSLHRISSCKLNISPSEKNGNFEVSGFELPATAPLHSKPIERSLKYVSFLDPKIEAVAEHAGEVESPIANKERGPSDSGWREDTKAAQRQQMHKSINMGMQEIMAKVVLETKWNSPIRKNIHSHSSSAHSKLLPPRGDMTIRNILFSPLEPMQVNGKSYPDFKFLPSPDYSTSYRQEDFPGSEPHGKSGTMEGIINIPEQNGHTVSVFDFNRGYDFAEKVKRKGEVEKEETEEDEEEEIAEKGHPCQYMTNNILSHTEAAPIRDFTSIHRELNHVRAPAEAMSHLEKHMVVGIKHATSSTFIPIGFHKQHVKTEMEPVQSPSFLLDQKISPDTKNRNLPSTFQSSYSHSLGTSERNPKATTLPLSRSHTNQAIASMSVTRLNRPHSFHISKLLTNDGKTIDIMKDEVFCKAALRGKKSRSKEHSNTPVINTTSNILRDMLVQFPVKEIVTDLDLAALNKEKKKRYQHLFQRHSIREISTTSTSEKPYVMLRERKVISEREESPRISEKSATFASSVSNGCSIQNRYGSPADNGSCSEDKQDYFHQILLQQKIEEVDSCWT